MYSVGMSLVDFIPVVLFLITAIIQMRAFYYQFTKWQFATFSAGSIMIFIAGFYKAIYKLLYALMICDFERLSLIFFPLQATGFILMGFAMTTFVIIKGDSGNNTNSSAKKPVGAAAFFASSEVAAPKPFSGVMLFVAGDIIGLLALYGSLIVIAKKMKQYLVIVLFVIAFFFMLGMGYLSSKDFTQASMNWIAEGVNIVGQLCFLIGTIILDKNGLKEYKS